MATRKVQKAEVTLTRLLSEIKLIDKKLEKVDTSKIGTIAKGSRLSNGLTEKEQLASDKSIIDSLDALLDRKAQLKATLAIANATSKVNFQGKLYSIVNLLALKKKVEECIKYNNSIIGYLNQLEKKVVEGNKKLDDEINEIIKSAHSNTKPSDDFVTRITNELYKAKGNKVVSSVTVESLSKENMELMTYIDEVNIALSEANATTKVEITLS